MKAYDNKSAAYRALSKAGLDKHQHYFDSDINGNFVPVIVAPNDAERIRQMGFATAHTMPVDIKLTKMGRASENRLKTFAY